MLRVRLTPAGGADRVEGVAVDSAGEPHIKARVRAAPEDGKANAALEALLAKALGVPKSAVRVERGATARIKSVAVDGVDAARIQSWLQSFGETA
ncbi:MAG: hypothetical protein FD124_430 [Alphaproteobacteria bacterium]|nr:MAG: hypothetical protein FD160_2624 [Caulobacteraceae bacterium]TPW08370.1 MAG: hypothetical protein FD124_430 [Alphaproteobacteria bacterium]